MRVKMSKQPPPAPTGSVVGPCPTIIRIVGRPGTGSLPSTFAQPDHPLEGWGRQRHCYYDDWLLVLGLTALLDSISVYIRLSRKGEKG